MLRGAPGDLAVAALEIAAIECPGLDPEPTLKQLDDWGARCHSLMSVLHLLYGQLCFSGNQRDYYNPLNSCLNSVVTRRTGIPITLSLVVWQVARRAGVTLDPIGLPGHFVLGVRGESLYVDAFHGGRLLSRDECIELAAQGAGVDISQDSDVFRPVPAAAVLFRMLNNLRAIYTSRNAYEKALQVLDLMTFATRSAELERARAQMQELVASRR
jgi:regulator of sirC expression with transglutaminase-like and TPR domain